MYLRLRSPHDAGSYKRIVQGQPSGRLSPSSASAMSRVYNNYDPARSAQYAHHIPVSLYGHPPSQLGPNTTSASQLYNRDPHYQVRNHSYQSTTKSQ